MLEIDHPKVRAYSRCVCCGGLKDAGLVLCWPCHHKQKARNDGDYSAYTKRAIDNLEAELA